MDQNSVPLDQRPGAPGQAPYYRPAILTLLRERRCRRDELVRRLTDLGFDPVPVCDLCRVLREMTGEGLVAPSWESGARRGRIYCLTTKGNEELDVAVQAMIGRRDGLVAMLARYGALPESAGLAPVGRQDGGNGVT